MDPLSIGALIATPLFSWLANKGSNKLQSQASTQGLNLVKRLIDMNEQQFKLDQPFRAGTLGRLNQRGDQQNPAFMPGKMPFMNPFNSMVRPQAPQAANGGPTALMQAIQAALQKRGPAPAQQFIGQDQPVPLGT